MSKSTSKENIQRIAFLCAKKGIRHIVMSPGSRDIPLIVAFNRIDSFKTHSIVDERSAGYFALGLAQRKKEPVILICTSGTALLNFAPAVAEAFYQNIPLIVLSADRPQEWVDQQDSQVIRQYDVLHNHIKKFYQINIEDTGKDNIWYLNRTVNEAVNLALSGCKGPVHINLPISEPLFEEADLIKDDTFDIKRVSGFKIEEEDLASYFEEIQDKKIMIVVSLNDYNESLSDALNKLSEKPNIIVLAESLSNIHPENETIIQCIDRTLSCVDRNFYDGYRPDILITAGGPIISKFFKETMRNFPDVRHWAIYKEDNIIDTYKHIECYFNADASQWFSLFSEYMDDKKCLDTEYKQLWNHADIKGKSRHEEFLKNIEWSDLKAFSMVAECLPENINLQISNGNSIRYRQIFDNISAEHEYCNRGTSGIDGSLSTAMGSASNYDGETVFITGDLSFLYDVNGLWNMNRPERMKIIILNNSGGGIFRFLKGPSALKEFIPYIETPESVNIKGIADAYGLCYYEAKDEDYLKNNLCRFFKDSSCAIMNIITPPEKNGEIFKEYFKYLRTN